MARKRWKDMIAMCPKCKKACSVHRSRTLYKSRNWIGYCTDFLCEACSTSAIKLYDENYRYVAYVHNFWDWPIRDYDEIPF